MITLTPLAALPASYQLSNLGFSSTAAFWSQVGVFVKEWPHQERETWGALSWNFPTSLPEGYHAFQLLVFQSTQERVDLGECLAWQRQFHLMKMEPEVLSQTSLLGRFRRLPEREQDVLWELAGVYLGEPSDLPIRQRLAQLREAWRSSEWRWKEESLLAQANGIFDKTGLDLAELSLKIYHDEARLHCYYREALFAAFVLFDLQGGFNEGDLPKHVERELLLRINFSEIADALARGDLLTATLLVGYSLLIINQFEQSELVEVAAWFADQMRPLVEGKTYSDLKEQVVLPRLKKVGCKNKGRLIPGIGMALLLLNPAVWEEYWPRLMEDFLAPGGE